MNNRRLTSRRCTWCGHTEYLDYPATCLRVAKIGATWGYLCHRISCLERLVHKIKAGEPNRD